MVIHFFPFLFSQLAIDYIYVMIKQIIISEINIYLIPS